jgi:hypothetical protein
MVPDPETPAAKHPITRLTDAGTEVYVFAGRAISEPRFPALSLHVSVPIIVYTRTEVLPYDNDNSLPESEVSHAPRYHFA